MDNIKANLFCMVAFGIVNVAFSIAKVAFSIVSVAFSIAKVAFTLKNTFIPNGFMLPKTN